MIEQLIAAARDGVEDRRAKTPQADLESRLRGRGDDRPFNEALVRPGLSVIAEFKRRSPSAGEISASATVAGALWPSTSPLSPVGTGRRAGRRSVSR